MSVHPKTFCGDGAYLLQFVYVMADTPTDTTPSPRKEPQDGVASRVILDMADTTWRMFVPTVGLLLVGRWFDTRYGFKPWLMLVGFSLGSLIAAMLIKRQLVRGDGN